MGKSKKEIYTQKEARSPKSHKTLSDDNIDSVSPIACPLAHKKLKKRLFKALRKASKVKHIKRGVKEVVKALRRGEKGLVVLAGDISPIDVISHLPVLCEDYSCPYIFVPSKDSLGQATYTQRPTSCIMIIPGGTDKDMNTAKNTYMEVYEEVLEQVENPHAWDQSMKNT